MPQYEFNELPNIDQAEVIDLLVCTEELRLATLDLITGVFEEKPEKARISPTFVCLMLLDRIVEGSLSCELLAAKNRCRDLAILLLSLYELSLDMQYMALERGREETWVAHAQENKKPWTVRSQQEAVFPNPAERDSEISLYRQYSMVKHCNPAAGMFAFPSIVQDRALVIERKEGNEDFVGVHLFVLGYCLYRGDEAAVRILSREGFDLAEHRARLSNLSDRLGQLNERHVIWMLNDWWLKTQPPPSVDAMLESS